MEVTDFIQDKKVVAILLASKSPSLKQKVTNSFDYFLAFSFITLSSLIITIVPGIVNQRINQVNLSKLSLESKLDYDKAKDFFSYDKRYLDKYNITKEQKDLVSYLEKDIITRVSYEINNSKELASQIVAASNDAGEDPFFIAAVIFSESSFRRNAKSPVGALGLMQIMPKTGEYIADKINYKLINKHKLTNPEVNLRLGIAYIQYLKKMFKNDTHKVLLAYNWGPTNVKKGKNPPSVSLNYSKKIHRLKNKWKKEFVSGYPNSNLLALNLS